VQIENITDRDVQWLVVVLHTYQYSTANLLPDVAAKALR
jgi:hypothetical protein